MHMIAEVVLPPSLDISQGVKEAMECFFDTKGDDEDWWDWYVIGGRFSGHKQEARIDKDVLERFYQVLKERKITVSSLQCGKQEISPASQIPLVDSLWREVCPGNGEKCWLFQHARDQYGKETVYYPDDVCTVSEVPERLECTRLIVASPDLLKEKSFSKITSMLTTEFWNKVDWQKTDYDGNVKAGIERINKKMDNFKEEYRERCLIRDDWNVVTVDYHN